MDDKNDKNDKTDMNDMIDEVNRALRVRGWSARYASRKIGGSPEFIRNLRRGHVASLEKFRTLCEVLDVEFYVGPRREFGAVDEQRLGRAIATVERALDDSGHVLTPGDKGSVFAAMYGLIDSESAPAITARVRRLIEAMASGLQSPRRKH